MSETLEELVRSSIRAEIGELRRFVDRRIAELSMEIHAAVQLVGYSETTLSAKLAGIHAQIAKVTAAPAGVARNSGIELEAVVQATEHAAYHIMGAAETISTWLAAGSDPAALPAVAQQINAVFEACTFQDLTGQRIRRAIQHLQQVESMLSGITRDNAPELGRSLAADLAQVDIDRILS